MFTGIEIALGVACSLMGIGGGYLMLVAFFAGLQRVSRRERSQKELDT